MDNIFERDCAMQNIPNVSPIHRRIRWQHARHQLCTANTVEGNTFCTQTKSRRVKNIPLPLKKSTLGPIIFNYRWHLQFYQNPTIYDFSPM